MTTDERIAAFLHDEYGCRITCRGGRLADDGNPSHNAAYIDQAKRLVAVLGDDVLEFYRLQHLELLHKLALSEERVAELAREVARLKAHIEKLERVDIYPSGIDDYYSPV